MYLTNKMYPFFACIGICMKIFLAVTGLKLLFSGSVKKCETCESFETGMYHGQCEKCAIVRWHWMPKKCNFVYDIDIHKSTRCFSDGWCMNESDPQYGMCHSCSISLYNYLCGDKLCLRKFIVENDNYSLCLAPANTDTNGMLLCEDCSSSKTFRHTIYKLFQELAYLSHNPVDTISKELSNRFLFNEVFIQRYDWGHAIYEKERRVFMENLQENRKNVEKENETNPITLKKDIVKWPYISNLTVERVLYLDLPRKPHQLYEDNIRKVFNCKELNMCFNCFKYECDEWVSSLGASGSWSLWRSFLWECVATPAYLDLTIPNPTVMLPTIDVQKEILSECDYCKQYSEEFDSNAVVDGLIEDCWEDEDVNYEPPMKRKKPLP